MHTVLWQDPLRADLDRFIDATQNRVSGKVRLKMEKDRLEWLAENQNILYTETIWQHMPQVQPLTRVLLKGSWKRGGLQSVIANSLIAGVSTDRKKKGGRK